MMRSLLSTAVIAIGVLFLTQDILTFKRTFKAGDKDSYRLTMSLAAGFGTFDIAMDLTQSVKKVEQDGSAEVESATKKLEIVAQGSKRTMPDPPPTVQKFDAAGKPIGAPTGGQGSRMLSLQFLRFVFLPLSNPLQPTGETAFEIPPTKDRPEAVVGVSKVESYKDGIATVSSKFSVTSPENATPVKYAVKLTVDFANGKIVKAEGTVSDIPKQGNTEIKSIQFVMERSAA